MRQTNIIWVGMCLIDASWTALVGAKSKHVSSFTVKNTPSADFFFFSDCLNFQEAIKLLMDRLKRPFFFRVLQATSPYIIVCFFFATFVFINGGIVIGDKSSHSVVFHPMQNLYFLAIATVFAAPHVIFEVSWKLKEVRF